MAGAEKRIKELRATFDSPDRYGKGLDWTGYTVHDAANILRRYFLHLPEPIIPLDFYEKFREPLRNHQAQAVGPMDAQAPDIGDFNPEAAIERYKQLITELPPLNRQLLLYILDLLAVFASKSDLNKMTTPNLAAIFQPGLLSHPIHDMAPPEYRLSQDVLIFLIENQDSFLIGMKGTAADEETVRDVQSGAPTPKTPSSPGAGRPKTTVTRSGSNASAGAESIRKFGGIRRNVSVSSRGSKQSVGTPSPVTPSYGNSSGGSGVHRSNTVPSKKSPAVPAARFPRDGRERPSDPPTPVTGGPGAPPASALPDLQSTSRSGVVPEAEQSQSLEPIVTSSLADENTTPVAGVATTGPHLSLPQDKSLKIDSSVDLQSTAVSTAQSAQKSPSTTPSAVSAGTPARTFTSMFNRSPTSEPEKKEVRKPNKLQKRRVPDSTNHSAHSSSHSLHEHPMSPSESSAVLLQGDTTKEKPVPMEASETPHRSTAANLKPTISPTNSFNSRSSVTDYSEHDATGESGSKLEREHRKRRWRLGSPNRRREKGSKDFSPDHAPLAGTEHKSTTSVGSASRALQTGSVETTQTSTSESQATASQVPHTSSEPMGRDPEKRGPIDWFRGKLQERREREGEKAREKKERGKTPPRGDASTSRSSMGQAPEGLRGDNRGRSIEVFRKDEAEA